MNDMPVLANQTIDGTGKPPTFNLPAVPGGNATIILSASAFLPQNIPQGQLSFSLFLNGNQTPLVIKGFTNESFSHTTLPTLMAPLGNLNPNAPNNIEARPVGSTQVDGNDVLSLLLVA
jgi:hypothetical protein